MNVQELDSYLDVKGLAQIIKDGPQGCRKHLRVKANESDSCRERRDDGQGCTANRRALRELRGVFVF